MADLDGLQVEYRSNRFWANWEGITYTGMTAEEVVAMVKRAVEAKKEEALVAASAAALLVTTALDDSPPVKPALAGIETSNEPVQNLTPIIGSNDANNASDNNSSNDSGSDSSSSGDSGGD